MTRTITVYVWPHGRGVVMLLYVSAMWLPYANLAISAGRLPITLKTHLINKVHTNDNVFFVTLTVKIFDRVMLVSPWYCGAKIILPYELEVVTMGAGSSLYYRNVPVVAYCLRQLVANKYIGGYAVKYNAETVL